MSSLDHNPPNATNHITAGGTDWLWTVFALMLVSLLGMIVWSIMVRQPYIVTPCHALLK